MTSNYYTVDESVAKSLKFNRTYMPDIERVTFNTKATKSVPVKGEDGKPVYEPVYEEDGKPRLDKSGNPVTRIKRTEVPLEIPRLTTKVEFKDGTFVVVRNSAVDPITVSKVKLSDGSEVATTDESSKERAIVYAIVKRLLGRWGAKKNRCEVSSNFGSVLSDIVKKAYDQNVQSVEAEIQKKKAKAEAAKAKAEAGAKPKRRVYTEQDVIQLLGEFLAKATQKA